MRQDDRGFSLVELVIAIAISAMVLFAAISFLGSSQKSYRMAEETIDLQMEAQILMEQIGNWVMESNRIRVDGTVLTLYSIPRNHGRSEAIFGGSAATNASKRMIWIRNGKLYMKQETGIADADSDTLPSSDYFETNAVPENCIAEHMEDFTPLHSLSANPRKVSVSLVMKYDKQNYSVQNDFTMRNEYIPVTASGRRALPQVAGWKGGCFNA